MISYDKLLNGSVLSESSHYMITAKMSNKAILTHIESGQTVTIESAYIEKFLDSADLFDKTVEVTKEDKKDGTLGIRSIWDNIHSSQVFTVCFTKQDKVKSKKQVEEEKVFIKNKALAFLDEAKKAKKSLVDACKDAIDLVLDYPVSEVEEGEDRVLRGYKVQFDSRDGFYDCIDLDITDSTNNIRKVNIRTIKWLIYNGVKYVVK